MVDAIERDIQRLTMRLAELQAENRHLRKRVEPSDNGARILRRAHRDALHLLNLHYAGYAISRPAALDVGLSERRWYWARALLLLARIHDGRTITEPAPAAALEAVNSAVELVRRCGLTRLRARNSKRH